MAEYIEREAFLERVDGIWDCADMVFEPNDKCYRSDDCASCKWRETKNAIRKIAAYLPAADVRPVVRSHWFDGACVNCGFKPALDYEYATAYDDYNEYRWNYCPNCGADMREES